MNAPVNAAVVGLGMGKHHIAQINQIEGMAVTAICDTNKDRLKAVSADLGEGVKTYADVRALARDKSIGLAVVATPHNAHAYYVYVCRHPQRGHIISQLQRWDVWVNISYPWPIHTMPAYAYLGYREGDLPHTESAAREIFSLPMYPSLADDEQRTVTDALHEILSN